MGKEGREDRFEQFNDLTSLIIGAAMRVHEELGPGLYESIYHNCMEIELAERGLGFRSQAPVAVLYRGQFVADEGYRLDIIVQDTVILELKAIEAVLPRHKMQVLTYLRLKDKPVGLLINFNVEHLRDGVSRIINPRWKPESP